MTWDPDRVRAVTLDSFSTVVDIDSTAPAVADLVSDPVAFARRWHRLAATYGMRGNLIGTYATYFELHVDALEALLAREGIQPDRTELRERTEIYYDMDVFADVEPALDRLREQGYLLGIVSNGDPAMVSAMVETAELEPFLDAVVSADEIRQHKPARALYEHAADRLGVETKSVAHVSNGYADVQGAMHAGMQGVWLDREGNPPDPFGPTPDLRLESLVDLLRPTE